jgi:hypothetical protein
VIFCSIGRRESGKYLAGPMRFFGRSFAALNFEFERHLLSGGLNAGWTNRPQAMPKGIRLDRLRERRPFPAKQIFNRYNLNVLETPLSRSNHACPCRVLSHSTRWLSDTHKHAELRVVSQFEVFTFW